MKQQKILLAGLILTVGLLIVGTGVALARGIQHGTPPVGPGDDSTQGGQEYWGPMHGSGWRREEETSFPPMMVGMVDALIDVTGLTEEEILAKVNNGQHLYDIALEAGLSYEELTDLMNDIHDENFSDEAELWDEDYSHMRPFGRLVETNDGEGFVPPCFNSDEFDSSQYGDRFQDRSW